jgi:hypothetical protein
MNRTARIVPRQEQLTATRRCGTVPAGVDLESGLFLCAYHLHQREAAPQRDEDALIAEAMRLLRENDARRREQRGQGR